MARTAALVLSTAVLLPLAVFANDCRFTLVDQSDWFANTGFYLDLENSPTGSTPYCQVAGLSIDMGVADGAQWRFIWANPAWAMDHDYTVKAVITPEYFELYLDGQLLSRVPGGFAGLPNQNLAAGMPPYGDTGVSNYLVSQSGLTAQSTTGVTASGVFLANGRPPALAIFDPGSMAQPLPFVFGADDVLTLTTVFRLTAVSPNLNAYAPYVDSYGQSVHSSFPGKIKADSDLRAAIAEEQAALAGWGIPSGYDAWGGVLNAGWQDAATGFFHVVQHHGVWWLISPAGNPCFYIGLDTGPLTTGNNTPTTGREWEFAALPPQTGPYNSAWAYGDWGNPGIASVSFDTWNLIRKYGSDAWQATAADLTVQRMQAWGFSGFGKWSTETGSLPILPVLQGYGVPMLTRHPDVFDPLIQRQLKGTLEQQIQSSVNNPSILGWSYGNEYDEIITPDEVTSILAMTSLVPAKQALVNQALSAIYGGDVGSMATAWGVTAGTAADLYSTQPTPPAPDIEALRQYYADQYYGLLYQTVKSIDPNHLYFGFWIVPGWWVNATDWQLIAAHVDVIGYDRYGPVFADSLVESLAKSTAKPVFLGEYSFPPHYNLERGYDVFPAAFATGDADAGAQYQANLEAAARNPWCVGVAWFEYRDEPVAGRGFLGAADLDLVEGENYAFGMVDVADRPKYDLVNRVRTTNLAMAQRRLAFAPPSLNTGGVVNNASFAGHTPVAPGSLVSIFGTGLSGANQTAPGVPLPLALGTTSLTMGGVPMPLVHAFPLQADAQVPWEVGGQSQAPLTIVTDDLSGNTVTVPLAQFSPGLYSMNGSGAGQGAILINGTAKVAAKGQPAGRGDYINIFATGLGPVSHQPGTGMPAPVSPLAETTHTVTATIGNVPAQVTFAGLAPGWVGLYQVNVQVPANAPVGDAVPLVLSVGGVVSNPVTMAIQ